MAISRRPLIGVFNERAMAERAIEELHNSGVNDDQISISGGTAGAGTGGGFLASIKSLFTGETASSSTLVNDLTNMGLSNEEANYYAREYEAGRTIVAVNSDGREGEVANLLRTNGAYTYQAGAGSTQAAGYTTTGTTYDQGTAYDRTAGTAYERTADTAYDQAAGTGYTDRTDQVTYDQGTAGTAYTDQTTTGAPYDRTGTDVETDESRRLRLREERLDVNKERVQSGEVRLRKDVVEEQRNIDVPVTHEEAYVERRSFGEGRVSDVPVGQDEVIRVPVSEEQVNVTKTPVETGEVAIGKRPVEETRTVSDTVRREEARLEKDGEPRLRSNLDRTDDTYTDTNPNV